MLILFTTPQINGIEHLHIMPIHAGSGCLPSDGGQVRRPAQIGGRVVRTMEIVCKEDTGDVVGTDIDSLNGCSCCRRGAGQS